MLIIDISVNYKRLSEFLASLIFEGTPAMRTNIILASAFALTIAGAAQAQQPAPVDTPASDRSAGTAGSAGASSSPDGTDRNSTTSTSRDRTGANSAGAKGSDVAACVADERTGEPAGSNASARDCAPTEAGKGDAMRSTPESAPDKSGETAPRTSNPTPPI